MVALQNHEDEEKDFFRNIRHIQAHRRGRAVARLKAAAIEGQLSISNLTQLMFPLVEHFIFEVTTAAQHNLVDTSVETMGALASRMGWSVYASALQKYMKLAREKRDMEKLMLRVVVAILDNFHFTSVTPHAAPVPAEDDDEDEPSAALLETPVVGLPDNIHNAIVSKVAENCCVPPAPPVAHSPLSHFSVLRCRDAVFA